MKRIKDIFGVDASNISVVDLTYIQTQGGLYGPTAEAACKVIDLEPGNYKVTIKIDGFCNEDVNESFELKTKGKVIIGDVCYLFSSDEPSEYHWSKFLAATDYLRINNEYAIFFDTHDDGTFEVEVSFEKLED